MTGQNNFSKALLFCLSGLLFLVSSHAFAARIKDLCEVQGARGNDLIGVGLVVGLAGTGDKSPEAVQAQQRMLRRLNINVDNLGSLKSDNTALVIVTGVFPAFAKEGTRFDVQVSSLNDCKSLEGGILLSTYLYGADNRVYASAQGALSVGGFNAGGGGGAGVTQNHVTVARIPMGAYVEREIPSTITDVERIVLTLKNPDFATAAHIKKAVEDFLQPGMAMAMGAGAVAIQIPPQYQSDLVTFIARVEDLQVEAEMPNRIVINERTGTVVVGGDVTIKPCRVAHGGITIEVVKKPVFPENVPAVGNETRQAQQTKVKVQTEKAFLAPVGGTTAADVADSLNKLKVTPRDMIAIFQALRSAGALDADLEIM